MTAKTTKARRAEQREQLLDTAIMATLEVLKDRSSPATARSSAAATAARLYEFLREKDIAEKPIAEMSYDELMQSVTELDEIIAAKTAAISDETIAPPEPPKSGTGLFD